MFAWHVVMRVQVIVWNYPDVVLVDKDMIDATTTGAVPRIPRGKSQLTNPPFPPLPLLLPLLLLFLVPVTRSNGLGRGASIKSFVGCSLHVMRPDGAPLHLMTSPYPLVLTEHVARGEWEKAMLLCR
jgi:hypothetical protein